MATKGSGFRTKCVHAGLDHCEATGSVAQPIVPSTIFSRTPGSGEMRKHLYTRRSNPNREALEQAVAELEHGALALAFSSGAAAIMSLLMSLPHESEVLLPQDLYYGTRQVLREVFNKHLVWQEIDMTRPDDVKRAISKKTSMVWIETPSNPGLKISDIAAISAIAHEHGALVAVDNTVATPMMQLPLTLGADIAMHSATKYMGGHSDVLLGVVVFKAEGEFSEMARKVQTVGGAVPSPHDSWMVRRGLMTMPLRLRAHNENAMRVSEWLQSHPSISRVNYPGLPGDPGHTVAKRQMCGFGGLLSFHLKAGAEAAQTLPSRTKLIANATSLGGVESLMEHRASVEGRSSPTPWDLVRLSVGVEDTEDIIADLDQALASLN